MFNRLHLGDQGFVAMLILALCAIALAVFGCAEIPTAPGTTDRSAAILPGNGGGDHGGNPYDADTTFISADTVVFLAAPAGDSACIHIQGKKVEFVVKPGAINDSVTIMIIGSRYKVGKEVELYTYECGPNGLQFSVPLELTQLINKSDGAAATLHYYDDSSSDGDGIGWETIGVSQVQGGKGVFLLSHFSKYGISYNISQGGQLDESTGERHFD